MREKENNRSWRVWIYLTFITLLFLWASSVVYADTEGTMNVSLSSSQMTCKVQLSDYQMPSDGEALTVAVWSDDKGQDDLAWRELSLANGSYSTSFSISEHGSVGQYQAHLYLRTKTGKMVFLNNKSFSVSGASCTSVSVTDYNEKTGSCKVLISGLTSPSGVTKVVVPTWCSSDQSDMVWYTAVKQDDGTWSADIDFSRHSNHKGTYQIHVYATSKNTIFNCVGKTSVDYPSKEGGVKLTADMQATSCKLTASGLSHEDGIKKVEFVVWSSTDGQDDLIWNTASYSSGTATKTIDLKDYCDFGTYNFHVYIITNSDKHVFIGKTTFEVPYPSAEKVEITTKDKTFTVSVSGISCVSGIDRVVVPIWSKADQSDIVWYTAAKQSDGSYKVTSDISKHGNSFGPYTVHVYVYDDRDSYGFNVASKSMSFQQRSAGELKITPNEDESVYTATISDVSVSESYATIQMAVWSDNNGQDDLVWYIAKENASTCTAAIPLSEHKGETGAYNLHLYAQQSDGTWLLIKRYTFEISKTGKTELTVVKKTSSTAEVSLTLATNVKASKVEFPTWCASDQSDLVWYQGVKQSDGSYKVTIDTSKHQNHSGTYIIHSYALDSTGKKTFLCKGSVDLTGTGSDENTLVINKKSDSMAEVSIKLASGISAAKVEFPTWCASDQSDLVWYQGVKQSDGSYKVTIDTSKHQNHSGTYIIHSYALDSAGKKTFLCKGSVDLTGTSRDESTLTITKKTDSKAEVTVKLASGISAAKVEFPTWCASDQSDLVWYQGVKQSDGSYKVTVDTAKHQNHSGTYIIHSYALDSAGKKTFLCKGSVDLTGTNSDENTLSINKKSDSTAEVSITPSSAINAAKIEFPTWCASDQSDLVWYQGVKQSDGSYKVTIDAAKHQYHSGTYIIHCYALDSNSNKTFLGQESVELQIDTPDIIGTATVKSCLITDNQMVTVKASVSGSGSFGLFKLDAGQTELAANATPLATVTGSGNITLTCPLNANTQSSLINEKLVIGQKQGNGYTRISDGNYITNPEAIASNTRAFPTVATKKGLQVNTTMVEDARELGVNHSVINVVLNNIPSSSGGIAYQYNGKTWYMNASYISSLDEVFSQQAANGSIVSAVLLMQWDSEWSDLIISTGRQAGYSFYGLNAETKEAREQLAAIFSFLANRYSTSAYNVVNWILGNEVNDFTNYNWCGNIGLQEYSEYYAHAYRLLYNSVKSQYSNARVYISMDHVWNYNRSYGFKGRDMFNAFVAELQDEGDINWNIAFHPYPNPITSPNFWKNRTLVSNSSTSGVYTMLNLQYLTDYIKNTYGSQHRFILSETGFTSVSGGTSDEKLQAAAIAYGYYLAEFNDMVDSFVVHRHVDHPSETSSGLYLGLWYTNSSYADSASSKKFSWTVYKYMDTSQGAAYTNFALSIIGANSWSSIVPGYTTARFN